MPHTKTNFPWAGYTASQVANYFLELSFQEGRPITVMKLIKMVYFAYSWCLELQNERLFREHIEAWKYGPVIPSLYHEFKHYGRLPITEMSQMIVFNDDVNEHSSDYERANGCCVREKEKPLPKSIRLVLDRVWQSYSPYTAVALSLITHREGSPWHEARRKNVDSYAGQAVLCDNEILKHFRMLKTAQGKEM